MPALRHRKGPGAAAACECSRQPPAGPHQRGSRPLEDRGRKARAQSGAGDLARLIDEVIGTAGQLAEKNKNRLVVETPENVGPFTADSMRLKQILLNLLSNACKFTKEGEVALRVRKVVDGRAWIELVVADNGGGVTPEQQERMF